MEATDRQSHLAQFDGDPAVRVSLDLESVLADVHGYMLEVYNEEFGTSYTRSDIDSWEWVREEIDWVDFNRIVNTGWEDRRDEVSPMEPGLDETVAELANTPGIHVDIVTARTGVETEMQDWLETHGITAYESFLSTTRSKADLGYDFYIDDRPGLADDLGSGQLQFLIEGPHNRGARDHDLVKPVETVREAVTEILDAHEANAAVPESETAAGN